MFQAHAMRVHCHARPPSARPNAEHIFAAGVAHTMHDLIMYAHTVLCLVVCSTGSFSMRANSEKRYILLESYVDVAIPFSDQKCVVLSILDMIC